jgi:hypothetical protein
MNKRDLSRRGYVSTYNEGWGSIVSQHPDTGHVTIPVALLLPYLYVRDRLKALFWRNLALERKHTRKRNQTTV